MCVCIYTEAGSIFGWERKDKAQLEWCFLFFLSLSLRFLLSLVGASSLFLDKDEKRRYQKEEEEGEEGDGEENDEQIMITEREWTYIARWIRAFLKAASLFIEHHYCSSMPFLAWPRRRKRRIVFAGNNNQIIYLLFLSQSASWLTSNTRIVIPHQCANISHEERKELEMINF